MESDGVENIDPKLSIWKYTKHAENKSKVHMQSSGGRNSIPPTFLTSVSRFPGGPTPSR